MEPGTFSPLVHKYPWRTQGNNERRLAGWQYVALAILLLAAIIIAVLGSSLVIRGEVLGIQTENIRWPEVLTPLIAQRNGRLVNTSQTSPISAALLWNEGAIGLAVAPTPKEFWTIVNVDDQSWLGVTSPNDSRFSKVRQVPEGIVKPILLSNLTLVYLNSTKNSLLAQQANGAIDSLVELTTGEQMIDYEVDFAAGEVYYLTSDVTGYHLWLLSNKREAKKLSDLIDFKPTEILSAEKRADQVLIRGESGDCVRYIISGTALSQIATCHEIADFIWAAGRSWSNWAEVTTSQRAGQWYSISGDRSEKFLFELESGKLFKNAASYSSNYYFVLYEQQLQGSNWIPQVSGFASYSKNLGFTKTLDIPATSTATDPFIVGTNLYLLVTDAAQYTTVRSYDLLNGGAGATVNLDICAGKNCTITALLDVQ